MRAVALLVAFLLLLAMPSAAPARAAAQDFGAVGVVNNLINVTSTPQLAPGDSGPFDFQFRSSYPAGMTMYNVSLNVSIYRYATVDASISVDGNWTYPYPVIAQTHTRSWWWNETSVAPGSSTNLSFTIQTSSDSNLMPYGSVFSPASYFLRNWLEFDGVVNGTSRHFRMASLGYFTKAQWDLAQVNLTSPCNPPSCRGDLNLTILGVDGVLPDSSFGVQEPIPRWPFYALIVVAAFFVVLAFLFWVEENPGTYPRVEAWWARQRGRLARIRPRRRRKPAEGEKPPP